MVFGDAAAFGGHPHLVVQLFTRIGALSQESVLLLDETLLEKAVAEDGEVNYILLSVAQCLSPSISLSSHVDLIGSGRMRPRWISFGLT